MNDIPIEFEVKVALPTLSDSSSLLAGLHLKNTTVGTDIYFDTSAHDLFLRGIFLRLRDQHLLEIKYNPDLKDVAHLSCQEHAFPWPLTIIANETIFEFLSACLGPIQSAHQKDPFVAFGLNQFVSITKHRTIYTGEGLEISLDVIENLGTFLEIEAKGADGIRRVQHFCKERGLVNLPIGYVELWLRKHAFPLYLNGRYVLPEDR